jgi:hypothetical protein
MVFSHAAAESQPPLFSLHSSVSRQMPSSAWKPSAHTQRKRSSWATQLACSGHAWSQPPQCAAVETSVSQPFSSLPSQVSKPCQHTMRWH